VSTLNETHNSHIELLISVFSRSISVRQWQCHCATTHHDASAYVCLRNTFTYLLNFCFSVLDISVHSADLLCRGRVSVREGCDWQIRYVTAACTRLVDHISYWYCFTLSFGVLYCTTLHCSNKTTLQLCLQPFADFGATYIIILQRFVRSAVVSAGKPACLTFVCGYVRVCERFATGLRCGSKLSWCWNPAEQRVILLRLTP